MHAQTLGPADAAIHLAAELEPDRGLTLTERLEDLDLSESQAAAVEKIIESQIETRAFHHAAGVLRKIFLFMAGRNATCAALAHGLGLYNEVTLTELAGALGCSKQNVQNIQRVLLPLVPFAPADTHRLPQKHPRPASPGEWLSVVEAHRVSGRSSAMLSEAAAAGEVVREFVGNQSYYREDTVMAWSEGVEQREAQARLTRRDRVWTKRQSQTVAPTMSPPPNSRALSGSVSLPAC
jgi:hypothetical protein